MYIHLASLASNLICTDLNNNKKQQQKNSLAKSFLSSLTGSNDWGFLVLVMQEDTFT